jgi:hypothetical protein
MKNLGLTKTIYAILIHLVFYVLPARYFKMYIYLTVISLLRKVRQATIDIAKINEANFLRGMNVSLSKDVMLFPEYSFSLIWKDELLEQNIPVAGKMMKIRAVLENPALTLDALDVLVDKIYYHLPFYDRLKLLGFNRKNELGVKMDLKEALLLN